MSSIPKVTQQELAKMEPQLRSAFHQALQGSCRLPSLSSSASGVKGEIEQGPCPLRPQGVREETGAWAWQAHSVGPRQRSGRTNEPVAEELWGPQEVMLEENQLLQGQMVFLKPSAPNFYPCLNSQLCRVAE